MAIKRINKPVVFIPDIHDDPYILEMGDFNSAKSIALISESSPEWSKEFELFNEYCAIYEKFPKLDYVAEKNKLSFRDIVDFYEKTNELLQKQNSAQSNALLNLRKKLFELTVEVDFSRKSTLTPGKMYTLRLIYVIERAIDFGIKITAYIGDYRSNVSTQNFVKSHEAEIRAAENKFIQIPGAPVINIPILIRYGAYAYGFYKLIYGLRQDRILHLVGGNHIPDCAAFLESYQIFEPKYTRTTDLIANIRRTLPVHIALWQEIFEIE
ncbi:hypothetical protein KY338_04370 [Candidatus Woesearchaeota archaeon]|nr:hypothetical protein [Candidatus Woesearchaeota archaeon]MBW3005783.1 hypothetical protein [Candidatus Woesearchaeota archaeon]